MSRGLGARGWLAVIAVVLSVGAAPGVASASTASPRAFSGRDGMSLSQAPAGLQAAVRRDLGPSGFSTAQGGDRQQAELVGSDTTGGDPGDNFGYSVAVWQNTAVVGAPNHDFSSGAAYVFVRSGSSWSQTDELTGSDEQGGDQFGLAVAIYGSTIVVGAASHNNYVGAAYVFTGSGGVFTQQAELTAPDGAENDYFGFSVGIWGSTIAVGAWGHNSSAGAAYVFTGSGASWSLQKELTSPDPSGPGYFGHAVSVWGSRVAVTEPGDNSPSGEAWVFASAGGRWNYYSELTASDATQYDDFGASVALSGNTVVVGAPGQNTGTAYVFTSSSGAWSQQAELTASDGAQGDLFGYSVAISGSTVVVGAPYRDNHTGAAYVFTGSDGTWYQQGELTASDGASDDEFGFSVAISGPTVLVGAPGHNSGAGTAYVFVVHKQSVSAS